MLLQPGQRAVLEFFLPHYPLSAERAAHLTRIDYREHLQACRAFWRRNSPPRRRVAARSGASTRCCMPACSTWICTPTARSRTVRWPRKSACIMAPSAPRARRSFNSWIPWAAMAIAERMLQFFLDMQEEDGSMLNFNEYKIETGAALWSMGEHYRYTRDDGLGAPHHPTAAQGVRISHAMARAQ